MTERQQTHQYHQQAVRAQNSVDPSISLSLEAMNKEFGWRTVGLLHSGPPGYWVFLLEREVDPEPSEAEEQNQYLQVKLDEVYADVSDLERQLEKAKREGERIAKIASYNRPVEKSLNEIERRWHQVARSPDPTDFVQFHAEMNLTEFLGDVRHILAQNVQLKKELDEK